MTQIANANARFNFASDPGHGWLLVTRGELSKAGLAEDDITPYSYRHPKGEILALEEDADARTFMTAYEALIGRPIEIEDTNLYPNIRAWPRFGSKACN